MLTRITLILCLAGAAATLAVGFLGCGWTFAVPGDAVIVPLAAGPYAVAAVAAWQRRGRPVASAIILATVALIAAFGLIAFGRAAWQRHTDPDCGMAMNLAALIVPAVQFAAVGALAVGLAAAWVIQRLSRPSATHGQ